MDMLNILDGTTILKEIGISIIISVYIYAYYLKIYNVIYIKSGLDKDIYKRKLSKKVVIKFCKISKKLGIKLNDEITDKQFDNIYKIYVDYQINKYSL